VVASRATTERRSADHCRRLGCHGATDQGGRGQRVLIRNSKPPSGYDGLPSPRHMKTLRGWRGGRSAGLASGAAPPPAGPRRCRASLAPAAPPTERACHVGERVSCISLECHAPPATTRCRMTRNGCPAGWPGTQSGPADWVWPGGSGRPRRLRDREPATADGFHAQRTPDSEGPKRCAGGSLARGRNPGLRGGVGVLAVQDCSRIGVSFPPVRESWFRWTGGTSRSST